MTYDTFEEIEEEKTKLTSRTEFKSAEALQGALDTGMEQGAIDSMERFAKHLEKYKNTCYKKGGNNEPRSHYIYRKPWPAVED